MLLRNFILLLTIVGTGSCQKYLEKKSDSSLATVESLDDLQALLDNYNFMTDARPAATIHCSDDLYVDETSITLFDEQTVNQYIWAEGNQFRPDAGNDWARLYKTIFTTNLVLEEVGRVFRNDDARTKYENVIGQAYFWRGYSYLEGVGIWCIAYDPLSATNDLGLPLRKSTNYNEKSVRSSLRETYDLIISDLKEAAKCLPPLSSHPLRPSRASAFAALARASLYMGDFNAAEAYADSSLGIYSTLMDFNSDPNVLSGAEFRFLRFNPEVLFDCLISTSGFKALAYVDTLLYRQYDEHDLRKQLYFDASTGPTQVFYRGGYSGSASSQAGIIVPEVILTRAECRVRNGNIAGGLQDVNSLLRKRFVSGTYSDFYTIESPLALDFILKERRKELVFSPLRWMDVKRLNKLGANIVLRRLSNGKEYVLPPNDLRYALSIPENIIEVSGIRQNPR